jgi:hypothetical protein
MADQIINAVWEHMDSSKHPQDNAALGGDASPANDTESPSTTTTTTTTTTALTWPCDPKVPLFGHSDEFASKFLFFAEQGMIPHSLSVFGKSVEQHSVQYVDALCTDTRKEIVAGRTPCVQGSVVIFKDGGGDLYFVQKEGEPEPLVCIRPTASGRPMIQTVADGSVDGSSRTLLEGLSEIFTFYRISAVVKFETECPVCAKAFNSAENQRQTLSCSHELCLECRIRVIDVQHDPCPTCRGAQGNPVAAATTLSAPLRDVVCVKAKPHHGIEEAGTDFFVRLAFPAPPRGPSVRPSRPALKIALAVDTSGSMRGRRIESAQAALIHTITWAAQHGNVHMRIVSFNCTAQLLIDKPVNVDTLEEFNKIATGLCTGGGTDVYAGFDACIKPGYHIIIFSDGDCFGADTRIQERVTQMERNKDPMEAVVFSAGISAEHNASLMGGIAKVCGDTGQYFFINDSLEERNQEREGLEEGCLPTMHSTQEVLEEFVKSVDSVVASACACYVDGLGEFEILGGQGELDKDLNRLTIHLGSLTNRRTVCIKVRAPKGIPHKSGPVVSVSVTGKVVGSSTLTGVSRQINVEFGPDAGEPDMEVSESAAIMIALEEQAKIMAAQGEERRRLADQAATRMVTETGRSDTNQVRSLRNYSMVEPSSSGGDISRTASASNHRSEAMFSRIRGQSNV